jgi:hypothetical protein
VRGVSLSALDWKAMFLDPAYDRNGKLHQIPQKITKKGVITDPGGYWKVVPIHQSRPFRGEFDIVELGIDPEYASSFMAGAEAENIVDPTGTATQMTIPGSTWRPRQQAFEPFTHLTFRTVSTPRFDHKGRAIGSKEESWIHGT